MTAAVTIPKVGQIWKEVDPRVDRYVMIVMVGPDLVRLQRCDADGNAMFTRVTSAQLRRFNGKRGGYALHRWETT